MQAYLDLLRDLLLYGVREPNRTGIDTLGLFARQLRNPSVSGVPNRLDSR